MSKSPQCPSCKSTDTRARKGWTTVVFCAVVAPLSFGLSSAIKHDDTAAAGLTALAVVLLLIAPFAALQAFTSRNACKVCNHRWP